MQLFELIQKDHRRSQDLLAKIEESDSASEALSLFQELDHELSWHASAEEETFYPVARRTTGDDGLLDEAWHEHTETRELLRDLRDMSPLSPEFREKIHMLRESVEHHIEEEEQTLFPKLERSMDPGGLARLGTAFRESKTKHMHDDTFVSRDPDLTNEDLDEEGVKDFRRAQLRDLH